MDPRDRLLQERQDLITKLRRYGIISKQEELDLARSQVASAFQAHTRQKIAEKEERERQTFDQAVSDLFGSLPPPPHPWGWLPK